VVVDDVRAEGATEPASSNYGNQVISHGSLPPGWHVEFLPLFGGDSTRRPLPAARCSRS
jgi:hypothetical protein